MTPETTPEPEPGPRRAAPASPDGTVTERPHPLTPVARSWIALVAMGFFLVRGFLEGDLDQGGRFGPLVIGVVAGIWLVVSIVHGYFDWRFTRFVIDDEQVRIDRKFINHTSERISFSKIQAVDVIQPLAARLMGLAKLRIDVGDALGAKQIEFLSRERAGRLRDYLLARAHGSRISVEQSARGPASDAWHDLSDADQVIVRMTPRRLVVAALTQLDWLVWFVVVLVLLVWGAAGRNLLPALGGSLAVVLGLAGTVVGRVVNQWNYTLTRSSGGLRITRGMTNLTSQSVPTDRVQGVVVTQGLLWRLLGLHKVQMTVLGTVAASGDESVSGVLVPAGTRAEVNAALAAIWPLTSLDAVPMERVPARARWRHPLRWRTMHWGFDDHLLVSRRGVFVRREDAVPHARVQSVSLSQGPWLRRLRLARIRADITVGRVDLWIGGLDAGQARELTLGEMDRCRRARALDARHRALAALPAPPRIQEPEPVGDVVGSAGE